MWLLCVPHSKHKSEVVTYLEQFSRSRTVYPECPAEAAATQSGGGEAHTDWAISAVWTEEKIPTTKSHCSAGLRV